MNLTKTAINRPSLIIVLFSVLILFGYVGYKNLSYELMPDFDQPVMTVKTLYPGATPEEVENSVSKKIEDALSNLEGLDYLVTKSLPNASIVIVNLNAGVDVDKTIQDATRYIDNIKNELPKEALSPEFSKVSPADLPIMSISATAEMPGTEFYQKMKDDYLPQIKQLKGVAEITVLGKQQREIQVKIDPDKLKLYQIPLERVTQAIIMSGKDIPAGEVKTDSERNLVRILGKFQTLEDIKNVQVGMKPSGVPIYVKNLAVVKDGIQEITDVSRYNGEEGIGLLIKKQGDANAVDVSKRVREQIKKIEEKNKKYKVKFIIADDTTDNTIAAVDSVIHDLIIAVILVSIIMLLFLRSFRNALIVLVAIPTSLVTAFAVMWLLGYTLNLMTLLAMSLIIGILVDDATVVLENIQRHLDSGKDRRTAAYEGRMEIGYSAISITLVDVIVFLPILFLQIFVADMLKEFSVVVITSTLTSLLVGFTLTPWLASRIGKKEDIRPTNFFNKFLIWFEKKLDQFIDWYGRQLEWVLDHKLIFGGFILLLIVLTGVLMKQQIIGQELIATGDQGKFRINLEYDKSFSVKQNNIYTHKIESFIQQQPDVESVFSNIGGPSSGIGSLGVGMPNESELTIQLKPIEERNGQPTQTYMIQLRKVLQDKYPLAKYSIAEIGLVARSAPIEITLSGSDLEQVMKEAQKLQEAIKQIPGADNVQLSVKEGSPEYRIIPDADKMQKLGLNTAYMGMAIRTALTGNDDASITQKGVEYPVRIWYDDIDRRDYSSLSQLNVVNQKGAPIQLSQIADIIRDKTPSMLERLNRQPAVTLTSEALGIPSGTLAAKVEEYLAKHPLPEGVEMRWGSDVAKQKDSFSALGKVLIISLLLIYLLLVALYDDFIYPLVTLLAIPGAIIGALLALNLSMSNLSVFTLLGLIMLMGLVTKNSILIVDFANHYKKEGLSTKEALIKAGKTRMRAIMMTTIAMAIGMLPIALAKGSASEWKNGLAWVIIGGLTSSFLITVYLVPVAYELVDQAKAKFQRIFSKSKILKKI